MSAANEHRYGFWPSPISADMVASSSLRFGQTALLNGVVYWSECRPDEGGRTVVVAHNGQQARDLFPAPFDARSRVHEYGGGAYCLGGGFCWFVNAKDQGIYRVADSGGDPILIAQQDAWRFGDLHWDRQRGRLLAVAETHKESIENCIAEIDVGGGAILPLIEGADFYASPRVSPNGTQLSWLEWQNPNMPWDFTILKCADLDAQGQVTDTEVLADGASIFQPEWTPSGQLLWSSDEDNWWNLYNSNGQLSQEQAECGLPLWNFNMATWAANEQSVYGLFSSGGAWCLVELGTQHANYFNLPFTFLEQLRVEGATAVFVAGCADQPMQVIRFDLASGEWVSLRSAAELTLPADHLSNPQAITFDTEDQEIAHGLYYPPCNPDVTVAANELPPLMVRCHGGPSAATSTAMEMKHQFWTSRGFAVLDVNYRGSTGYGRQFRRSLYGHWGVKDVSDAVRGAQYLAAEGLVDSDKLFISGSSAGGFTVLSALTFHNCFAAGGSYYGIGDLRAIMDDTHKFEARYGDQLIGPWESHEAVYRERSPLFSAERLQCPVIFFQGLDDKIVPPNQAQMMVDALREKGITTEHYEFAGESHGFRKHETVVTTLERELAFYQNVMRSIAVNTAANEANL